jgi:hypothetical protein
MARFRSALWHLSDTSSILAGSKSFPFIGKGPRAYDNTADLEGANPVQPRPSWPRRLGLDSLDRNLLAHPHDPRSHAAGLRWGAADVFGLWAGHGHSVAAVAREAPDHRRELHRQHSVQLREMRDKGTADWGSRQSLGRARTVLALKCDLVHRDFSRTACILTVPIGGGCFLWLP